jgi:Xaa-Pro aminopeptidase
MRSRLDQMQSLLAKRGLDAALITSPANRFYLSGYTMDGIAASAGIVLVDREAVRICTNANNTGWASATAHPGVEVEQLERPWETWLAKRMEEAGWRTVGFEDTDLTVASFRALEAGDKPPTLVALGDSVDRLRTVKDEAELARITEAIRLNDEVFTTATRELTAGTTERELAWRIDRTMRELGGDGNAFPTIVAAGPHAANPHHEPTDRPIEAGEPVIIDMGVRYRGYLSDLTRTIWLGEPSPTLRAVYNIVYQANAAAIAGIRPGMTSKESDQIGRDVIEAAGHGERFVHGLGHGVGIQIHEAPFMGKTHEYVLPVGAIITIEPGIYIPEWGGVRIEDVGVLEREGVRVLTRAPKPDLSAAARV